RQRQSGGSPGPSHESVYSLPSEQSLSPTSQRNGPPSTLAPPYVASQTTCPTESKQSVSSAVMSHGWSAVSSVHEDVSMQSMTRLAAAVQTSLLPTYVSVKYSKQDSGHESSS